MSTPATKLARTPQKKGGLFDSAEKRNLVLSLLIGLAVLALYNPVNRHPFVNYDDDRYVTENLQVRAGLSWNTLSWAFTSTEQANWHPLTWLSHALDYQLFHLNPTGHHFTSLLIHALNAALLFLLLMWATGRAGPSLFASALFALHPINVESVAWVAERKNVLCTFFFLATLGAYGWYARKPNWRRYLAVAAGFALALLSKPMAVTLPFALILLDYWPLGRVANHLPSTLPIPKFKLPRLGLEKLPLLALSAASAAITLRAQHAGGAVRSTAQFSLGVRIANAVLAYALYLWRALWPARLAPLYPHPGASIAFGHLGLAVLALSSISAGVFLLRSKRYLPVGWVWFLGTLVPVIGLVQVGDAAMADRYAYIPLIGVFAMISFGLADLAEAGAASMASRAIPAACILLALALATHRQLGYWSSSYDLWAHTVAVTGPNFIAQDNLGGALLLAGKADEAYPHFLTAAEINPRDPMSHANIGAYLQDRHQLQAAIAQYETTIRLTSDRGLLASTYANLGSAYRDLDQDVQARQSYDLALQLNPAQFNAYLGRGVLLEKQGNLNHAILDFSRSVQLMPTTEGYLRLGHALQLQNRRTEALAAYQAALQLSPDSAEAQQAAAQLSQYTNH